MNWQKWFPLLTLLYKRHKKVQSASPSVPNELHDLWRADLIAAILANNIPKTRQLIHGRPIPRPDDRHYGVVVETENGVDLIVVGPDGERVSRDAIVGAVDVLNLESKAP